MLPSSVPVFHPIATPAAVVTCGKARFTVLKSRLIRMEYDPDAHFDDRPSQVFWYREQAVPSFQVHDEGDRLVLETSHLVLRFKKDGEFHWRDLEIFIKESNRTWHYGDRDYTNLRGTARTLDRANGRIPLDTGLASRSGWSLVDDSAKLVFDETGWLTPRNKAEGYQDLYFFGYGEAYTDAIKEYQDITGKPGLLPRWALGNWWSRYWAYSQEELLDLMLDFQAQNIPLSVCIVDMDWHITKTGNTSSGWTGYSWNRELFPKPEQFIDDLHALNLKTALNLHPAEGVFPHETQYPEFARSLGVDPESRQPIAFDIASKPFTQSYFELLHHPLEKLGIDFWWLDWQQGTRATLAGLDPLYWLNHLHYFDLGREATKRRFIFSRWPGLGGHRYPIGFSGDTIVSWESMAFQPEFTATAANVAYGWWSHDIGGHCEGIEDAELYTRWVQFGIFSPIMRLHSTNNPYCDRRPWGYDLDTLAVTRVALQLRRQLIPMLYSSAYHNAQTGEPILLPMYHAWPEEEEAYRCPQEYLFCQNLLVAPFAQPADPDTGLARQVAWLPAGDWYHFLTGEYQEGGGWLSMYGNLDEVPVFAKAGAIIPMDVDRTSNGVANPTQLLLKVFAGANGAFDLYEDDGETQAYLNGDYTLTKLELESTDRVLRFSKQAVVGNPEVLPEAREYRLEFFGLSRPGDMRLLVGDEELRVEYAYDQANHCLVVGPISCAHTQPFTLELSGVKTAREGVDMHTRLEHVIKPAKIPTIVKQIFWQRLEGILANPLSFLEIAHNFTESQQLAIFEAIFPLRVDPISTDPKIAYADMRDFFSKMG